MPALILPQRPTIREPALAEWREHIAIFLVVEWARNSLSDDALVAKFVSAYEAADIDALTALLTDEAFVSMPPLLRRR